MGGDGYGFDPEAAKQVEKGLKGAIAELESVGLMSITSQQGHGFSRMSMSGLALGDAALAAKFEEFCDRWGSAVNQKMHDANDLAEGLGLSAGLYHEQEQYVVDSLKEVVSGATSYDPAVAASASDSASDKSWSEIKDDALGRNSTPADFSLPEFDEAGKQWEQVGQDVESSPFLGGSPDWDGDGAGGGQQDGQQQDGEHGGKR